MVKISKRPALGISEEKRKKRLAEMGYSLKKNRTGDFTLSRKGNQRKQGLV